MNELSTGADNSSQKPLIVLDRDGVINQDSTEFIKSPDEWIALPGSPEAIGRLCAAGFTIIIATNQSGIGRGFFSLETLGKIHDKMSDTVTAAGGQLDAIYFCPHKPTAGCDCRKPKPGLLKQVSEDYGRPAAELIVVGDSLRDLESAWAIGAPAVLLRSGNGNITETKLPPNRPVDVYDDLSDFVDNLINDANA